MSTTTKKFLVAYVCLVLLPIAGLAGILRQGYRLTAPISVDGVWKLHANVTQLATLPCGHALASLEDPTLGISQSGRNFTLDLASGLKTKTSGVIDGARLSATMAPSDAWAGGAGCGKDRVFSLVASVNPNTDPKSLAGTLSVNDCPSCSPVEFQAVRQAPPAKKGAH